jgi:hypothetical protein
MSSGKITVKWWKEVVVAYLGSSSSTKESREKFRQDNRSVCQDLYGFPTYLKRNLGLTAAEFAFCCFPIGNVSYL